MTPEFPGEDILCRLAPSKPRLWIGTFAVAGVAAVILWIAATGTFTPASRFLVAVFGVLMGLGAYKFYRSADVSLEFDGKTLSETGDGRVLAELDNIKRIERGALAFKPSSGFLIVLKAKAGPNAWVPGMWWRLGRHVGVGGIVPSHAGKFMAEMIEMRVAARDGGAADSDR